MASRKFFSFLMKKEKLSVYEEEYELKEKGRIKAVVGYQKGWYCIGGDGFVHFVEFKEDGGDDGKGKGKGKDVGKKGRKKGGSSKKSTGALSVGIQGRRRRKGFL